MKEPRRAVSSLLAILAFAIVPSTADAKFAGAGGGKAEFTARGPAGLTIKGESSQVEAAEAEGKLKVVVQTGGFKTGIALRDKHLRGYLESEKFPTSTLVIDRAEIKLPDDGKSSSAAAKGAFTLHGVTKTVPFSYSSTRKGSEYAASGRFAIDIRDYGIEVPSFAGVKVSPNVDIVVGFKVRDD